MSKRPRSNWNLEVLVFEERENWSTSKKTSQSKGENQQQMQPTHMVLNQVLNPIHFGWRQVFLTSVPP